jgi:hypothetical protein
MPARRAELPVVGTCSRFAFAIDEGRRADDRNKRRREVVEYLLERFESAEVVDEWDDDGERWLSVEIPTPISTRAVAGVLSECPRYIRRSFAVDRAG